MRRRFQYPILRIVGCKKEKHGRGKGRDRELSVSYPADRWLQDVAGGFHHPHVVLDFQYPILRIVGCKKMKLWPAAWNLLLSVSYPADRWLQELAPQIVDALRSPFSILSCGSLVASLCRNAGRHGGGHGFQYPILRIVGCKPLA